MANLTDRSKEHAAIPLLSAVLTQLEQGADSGVEPPGTDVTKCTNFFPDPQDCLKMADALATEIKAGNMAGPLNSKDFPTTKVNSFMAVPKPYGHRRQVGNMSAPEGNSFNDGISTETLNAWGVVQTTAKQFAYKITRAGRNSTMSKADMVNAYKTIKVCMKQRRLQGFQFCGKLFLDLCLIFGDQAACMWYDRFHFCILSYFVLPKTTIPPPAVGETVDDITVVVPDKGKEALAKFVKSYREELGSLNIQAAPSDPACIKAFDESQEGEILGMTFFTKKMKWNMGHKKTKETSDMLWEVSAKTSLSLHEAEVLVGKVQWFAQLADPINLLSDHIKDFLKNLIHLHTAKGQEDREATHMATTDVLKDTCRTMATIIKDTASNPLPILVKRSRCLLAVPVFTDASGDLQGSASLGILSETYKKVKPMVASLRFPFKFLLSLDKHGKAMYHKSTLLEATGPLATLLMQPDRFIGQSAVFIQDSQAAVLALNTGKSQFDELATTIVKACRVVAAYLNCNISAEWIPRRSNR